MKVNRITNYIIVALVLAAIYQTQELWLAKATSHNFFHAIFSSIDQRTATQLGDHALMDTKYAIGDGTSNFTLYYPDQSGSSDALEAANQVLQEILSENIGKSTALIEADWQTMLQKSCMVVQYDFMIPMDDYLANIRSLKNGQPLQSFDCIILSPGKYTGEESIAYLVNTHENTAVCYEAEKSKSAPMLFELLTRHENDMVYISTGQKTGSAVLRHNLFLPQFARMPYHYPVIEQQAAFEENNALSRTLLENTAEHFFANFSVDWSSRDEKGNFIFSDSSVVLKYYPSNRVLEYYNYDNYGNDSQQVSLLDGYQICSQFLKNDTSLQTSIFLSAIAENGNERIYYFDYAVDNLPVMLSDETKTAIDMPHAIAVTVQNHSVKKYRRYAVNFHTTQWTEEIQVPFIDALDQANRLYQQTISPREIAEVQNISLAYDATQPSHISLKWFVTLYDECFAIPVKQIPLPEPTAQTPNT